MFTEDDKIFLSNSNYSMPLEKFYDSFYYEEKNDKNGTMTQAYPFSNENLDFIFKHLKTKNSKVLTVGSSGDQLLQSLFNGATEVTVIDGNIYSKPWIEYKLAAIKNLDFETFKTHFLNFFNNNKTPFDYEIYSKIFHDLSDESKTFWGNILLDCPTPQFICKEIIHRSDISQENIKSCFYKNKVYFNELKNILNNKTFNIQFINEEFTKFPQILSETYDIILLSNIKSYIDNETFVKTANLLYNNNLNNKGFMQLHYNFHYFPYKLTKNAPYYRSKNPNFEELFPNKKIINLSLGGRHHTFIMQKTLTNKKIFGHELGEE